MTTTTHASRTPASRRLDDERTVGDLLLEADIAVRELLWDAPPDTAKAKARSWGEVVEAAAELWSSFPDRTGDPSMDRIHKLTVGMHRTQQRTGWPGPGEGDPHLERVTENLARATEMISSRRHPTARLSERGHLDSEAARTRIMHVVYVASHGVGQSLWQYNRDLRRVLNAKHRLSQGQSADQSHNLLVRVGAAEQLAASYLQGRWPAGLNGQHRDPVEPARLEQAVASWDVQARRTLAAAPTVADVLFTVKVERDLTLSGGRIVAAAADVGVVDAEQHRQRLEPAFAQLDEAWGRLGGELEQLAGRARRVDPELLRCGTELRASLREISADLGGQAGPATMAQRADLHAASLEVHRGLIAAVDLGFVLRDAVTDPDLTAPARSAQVACLLFADQPDTAAWVDAGDAYANRPVPLPDALRQSLSERSASVVAAGLRVDSAGSFLGATRQPSTAGPVIDGRAHEERAIGLPPAPGPRYGCDR